MRPHRPSRGWRSARRDVGRRRRQRRARHAARRRSARARRAVSMTVRADMVNGYDLCHGGLIAALADSAFALRLQLPRHPSPSPPASTSTFLEPARLGDVLVAHAREARPARPLAGCTTSPCARRGHRDRRVPRPQPLAGSAHLTGQARCRHQAVEGERGDGVGELRRRRRGPRGGSHSTSEFTIPNSSRLTSRGSRSARSAPSSAACAHQLGEPVRRCRGGARGRRARPRCCRAPAAAGSPRAGGRRAPRRCRARRRAAARRRVATCRPARVVERGREPVERLVERRGRAGAPCSARGGRSRTWSARARGPGRPCSWRRSPAG